MITKGQFYLYNINKWHWYSNKLPYMHENIATEISYQKRMRQTGMQYNVLQIKMASGMLHGNYLSADWMPEKRKVYIIELIIKVFLFEIKVYFFLYNLWLHLSHLVWGDYVFSSFLQPQRLCLNLTCLEQRKSGEMYWMTFPRPWLKVTVVALINKNLLVCRIKWEPLIQSLENFIDSYC